MPRIKSLIASVKVEEAKKAHNCRWNRASHRINRGDKRLKVKDGRNSLLYCLACAKSIVRRDIERLQKLQKELEDFGTS